MFIKVENGRPVKVSASLPLKDLRDRTWQDRWQWKDFATVEKLARYVTAMTGRDHLPVDRGSSTAPRFDVIEAPRVGDPVSYGFNGDYYPCGYITKITKGWRVTTSEGKVFNRRNFGAGWVMVGGTWGMVAGHINERNPHF